MTPQWILWLKIFEIIAFIAIIYFSHKALRNTIIFMKEQNDFNESTAEVLTDHNKRIRDLENPES